MTAGAVDAGSTLVDAPQEQEEFDRWALEHGWGDGLPLVAPTPERVARMLEATGAEAAHVVCRTPPLFREATLEAIAANAVMAGCLPEHLQVVVAALQAATDPAFNFYGIQATTHPCAFMVMLNGPLAAELQVHSGAGCLGPGFRANAVIGRAMRLILQNVGGAYPGSSDRATQGSPAKFSFCFAENEAESPWEPYHVQLGHDAATSTVTVAASEGPHNIDDHESTEPPELMTRICHSIASLGANNAYCRNSDYFVGLCPEHARTLARRGWTKADVRECIHQKARTPYRLWRTGGLSTIAPQPRWISAAADDDLIPMSDGPDDVRVVVIGGPGLHSCWMPSYAVGRSVTRAIGPPP